VKDWSRFRLAQIPMGMGLRTSAMIMAMERLPTTVVNEPMIVTACKIKSPRDPTYLPEQSASGGDEKPVAK